VVADRLARTPGSDRFVEGGTMKEWWTLARHDLLSPRTLAGAVTYGLVLLAAAWIVARALRIAVGQALARVDRAMVDRTSVTFLTQLAQIAIYVFALTFYAHLIPELRSVGTALLTSVGVASIVVGLAAQNTLGNVVAGISLVLYRPFQVDDQVQVAAPTGLETGVVESLTLGYTVLRTYDNRRIVVPNSVMATQVTVNLTSKDPRVMLALPIGIGYGADLDLARSILVGLAKGHADVDSVVDCPVTQLGSSAVTLTLRAWCPNAAAAKRAEYDLYETAKRRFDEARVEIPFPSSNVIVTLPGGLPPSDTP
jgi:small conductance mechanosensitive channel